MLGRSHLVQSDRAGRVAVGVALWGDLEALSVWLKHSSQIASPCLHVDAFQVPVSVAELLDLPGAGVILKVPDIDWPAKTILA